MLFSQIAAALVAVPAVLAQSDVPVSPELQKIISDAASDPKYDYPTSLTRGIVPKGFHSHNDYWREVPFYSALKVGAISIEADVWLYNGTLHVGHDKSSLTNARTLDSLYIQPILSVLKQQNPNSTFVDGATRNGVYDTVPGQTLYLFVDIKTDGATTFPAVVKALQPLRDAGYLTTFDGLTVTQGPITVIGTGNTPLTQVQGVAPRDFFWDAPIPISAVIPSTVSPIASTSFNVFFPGVRGNEGLNDAQKVLLAAQVAVAKVKGMKLRFWDQPGWPVGTRNAIWRSLWDAGVDILNVDDLEAAADFWESRG